MSKFIVIDGTDGSGKGTQISLLEAELKACGYSVLLVDFPQYGEKSCTLVEEYLNGVYGSASEVNAYQASVFYAVDRFAAKFKMQEHLAQGGVILANRYVSSNQIHQSGKMKDAQQLQDFLTWLDHFEFTLMGIPRPDRVFFLDVPPHISDRLVEDKGVRSYIRGGKSKDIHEEDEQHIMDAYTRACELVDRYEEWSRLDCLDEQGALRSIESIAQELATEVKRILHE